MDSIPATEIKDYPSFFQKPNKTKIIYVLSAASILAGAGLILSPLYEKSGLSWEQFYLVGILALYELALLLVGYLVCRWKAGNDDAKTLTLLMIIFLIAAPISLDTISLDFPKSALCWGVIGLILAGMKLSVMQKHIIRPFLTGVLVAFALMLLPSFIMPGVLGLSIQSNTSLFFFWLFGWGMTLFGGGVILREVASIPTGQSSEGEKELPFLHTSLMRWILTLVFLFACFVRQYILSYAYSLHRQLSWVDFLPAFAIMILVGGELFRAYKVWQNELIRGGLLTTLLLISLFPLSYPHYYKPSSLYLLSYPPVFFSIMTFTLLLLAKKSSPAFYRRWALLYFILALTFVDSFLYTGFISWPSPNWFVFGLAVSFLLFRFALQKKSPGFAVAAAVIVSLDIAHGLRLAKGNFPELWQWLLSSHLYPETLPLFIFSSLMLVIVGIFPQKIPQLWAFLTVCLLAGWTSDFYNYFLSHSQALYFPTIMCFVVLGASAWVAIRNRYWFLFAPAFFPSMLMMRKFLYGNVGWILILLSFLLLTHGCYLSYRAIENAKGMEQ